VDELPPYSLQFVPVSYVNRSHAWRDCTSSGISLPVISGTIAPGVTSVFRPIPMTDSDGNVFFVFLLAFNVSVWPRIVAAYDGDGNAYVPIHTTTA